MPTRPAEWIALRVDVPRAVADAVANFLVERGSPGVITEDVDAERVRVEGALRADASGDVALERWLASLAEVDASARDIHVDAHPVPAVDWTTVWRRHHRPVAVGERLLVAPPWNVPPARGREVLVIEPGMAFGTGEHATTRGCLEAIESVVATGAVRSALDVGTGSGILALALARLGVARVVAVDSDAAVLPIARENLRRNGAPGVIVVAGTVAAVRAAFDVVVANLLAETVIAEAAALGRAVAAGGRLVLSGLLDTQAAAVAAAYPGWRVVGERSANAWRTLVLAR